MLKEIKVKTTSLAAALFLTAPIITLVLWIFSWHAANGIFTSAVSVFLKIQNSVFLLFALLAIVFSLMAFLKKGKRFDKWDKKEDALLLALSVLIAIIYLIFNL